MKTVKVLLKVSVVLVCVVFAYPLLVWVYCLTDDYILRRDAGRWEFHNGTFWHTYHAGATQRSKGKGSVRFS